MNGERKIRPWSPDLKLYGLVKVLALSWKVIIGSLGLTEVQKVEPRRFQELRSTREKDHI